MIRILGTVQGLLSAGGIAVGIEMGLFEMQNGIQAIDVLLMLQVLVLTSMWHLTRDVAGFRSELKTKATPREVGEAVKRALNDYREGSNEI